MRATRALNTALLLAVIGSVFEAHLVRLGDWAIEQYAGVVTMTPKAGGESMTENLRGIHIYRRGEDGAWKISHDIWSADKHAGAE